MPRKNQKPTLTTLPDDDAYIANLAHDIMDDAFWGWARKHGLLHAVVMDEWERFTNQALAKAYKYANWRRAFMVWLTNPNYRHPYQEQSRNQVAFERFSNGA